MEQNQRSTGQQWNPELYARFASFVPKLGEALLALLKPKAGEHILDLGCGDGALSEKIVAAGAVVVGIDESAQMLDAAARRGIKVRQLDAHELDYRGEFDAVFSNAALHWMKDPDRVIAGVARALKPGGRFVAEMGGCGNVAAIMVALLAALKHRGIDGRSALPYYPSVEEYRARLESAGFSVDYIELIPRPTPLPDGIAAWLDTFGHHFLHLLPAAERVSVRDEVVELLRPLLCDWKGNWIADYVRLRFAAHLS
jgi:trans-aconitate methyltransferase